MVPVRACVCPLPAARSHLFGPQIISCVPVAEGDQARRARDGAPGPDYCRAQSFVPFLSLPQFSRMGNVSGRLLKNKVARVTDHFLLLPSLASPPGALLGSSGRISFVAPIMK